MRPTCCRFCGGPLVQELVERLDVDGRVVTGSVACRACDQRWLYSVPVPAAAVPVQASLELVP